MPNKKGKRKAAKVAKAAGARQRMSAAESNEALVIAMTNNILLSGDARGMRAQAAIDAGADVNNLQDNWSGLKMASFQGHAAIVALLLNAGADTEAKHEYGNTALLVVVHQGHTECLKLLLKADADTEAADEIGNTALLLAAEYGYAECVKRLLNSGADKDAKDLRLC
jgi:ankyrin repeat protein